jgi:ligand-binding SRPBCC domain-containing protein
MKSYSLKATQVIKASLEESWSFFSSPSNLGKITPPSMGFKITSQMEPEKMYPGQIITYRVRPFLGITITWVTEISNIREKKSFTDVQRFGPYKLWHHYHAFREIPEGVEMSDTVCYALPYGFFGRMAHPVVRKKLQQIFDYRRRKITEIFG